MQQLFFVTEPYETNEKNRENELQKKRSLMDDLNMLMKISICENFCLFLLSSGVRFL